MKVLVAGAGYVGLALAKRLTAQGHSVTALRRHPPEERHDAIDWVAADLLSDDWHESLDHAPDAVVFAASPSEFSESAYRETYLLAQQTLLKALLRAGVELQRYIMVSSTAVYPLGNGEWINVDTPAAPQRFTGHVLLSAENWLREQLGHRLTVARLTGIYGPGRWRSMTQRLLQRGCNPKQFSNRIHRDDAAGFLAHILGMVTPAGLYLVSDSHPSDQCTVAHWLAEKLGQPPPVEEMERTSPRGNKRVSNAAMLATGYQLEHEDFRSGLEQAMAEDASTNSKE
jgi:nucleoside-diphosphate-sugar epimerase